MNWAACAAGCLLGAGVALSASASEAVAVSRTPVEWLAFMAEAHRERSFDGVFSYFDGDDLATLRVVHAVIDGVQRERLVHLDGEPREIVRKDSDVVCILQPDDAILKLEAAIPSGPFGRAFGHHAQEIGSQYDVSYEGVGRVADRAAVRIVVAPRDEDRYGYRLWIDAQKGLLLRSEVLDAAGARVEIFQFTDVRIDEPVDPALLEPVYRDGAVAHRLAEPPGPSEAPEEPNEAAMARTTEPATWRVEWMPPGFAMSVADVRRTPSSQRPIETLMYSDGLAAFSVFIEEMPPAGAASAVSRQGGTVAVTQHAAGPGGKGYLVTVVGEVPIATAQRVARSIRFAAEAR